jgi:diguanylate cyclase (GGDEF)-like protein
VVPVAGSAATLPIHTGTPLLTAAIPAPAVTTATGAAGHPNRSAHHDAPGTSSNGSSPAPLTKVINTIEKVIPGYVWAAIAASLLVAALAGLAAFVAGRRVRRQAGQFAAVTAAAMTDPLTGVLNRRGFIDALERELARARRYGLMFTLAYVDVRGLKAVNDTEGHLAGDRLLNEAAHLLKDSARADDVVGRIGGDEMGLLLVEQGAEGADAVIRRVTSQVPERREALGIHSPWDLTVGTASFPEDGSTVNELLATADRRLYEQRGIALR